MTDLKKNICRKTSQQLNVIKRIGCFLSKLNKLTFFLLSFSLILIFVHWRGIFAIKVIPLN